MVWFVQMRSFASLALQLAILGALVAAFFVRWPQVVGPSMEPHISPGERVLVNTLAYRFGSPQRGDIVAFRHVAVTPELYIKRVIGLPGDRVRIDNGVVWVNGKVLPEPYLQYRDKRSMIEITIPPGSLFVLGDNRANSEDSRFFGPVSDADLMGKAVAGLWPLEHVGSL